MRFTDLLAADVEEWRNSDDEFDEAWYLGADVGALGAPNVQPPTCVCGCGGPYVKPGTVEYYKCHLDHPVARGVDSDGNPVDSSVTVRELVMAILRLHLRYSISKDCMDVLLCLFANVVPGVHFIPRSIHLLRKVTDTPDHSQFQMHVCAAKGCTGHVYPGLTNRKTWLDHVSDKCPKCSHPRFHVTEFGGQCWGYCRRGCMSCLACVIRVRALFGCMGWMACMGCMGSQVL